MSRLAYSVKQTVFIVDPLNPTDPIELERTVYETVHMCFSPTNSHLLCCVDGNVNVWDMSTMTKRTFLRWRGRCVKAEFASDPDVVVSSSATVMIVWNVISFSVLRLFEYDGVVFSSKQGFNCIRVSNSRDALLTIKNSRTINVWDAKSFFITKTTVVDELDSKADFSKDDNLIAVITIHSVVFILDSSTLGVLKTIDVCPCSVFFMEFSPIRDELLVSYGQSYSIFDAGTGDLVRSESFSDLVFCVRYSKTAGILYLSFYQSGIDVIDLTSNRVLQNIKTDSGSPLMAEDNSCVVLL
jgi:WD40 repeat protein